MSDYTREDIEYGIDGGFYRIYDGVIIWVLKDGRYVNRFRGDGSRREAKIDELIEELTTQAKSLERSQN